MRPTHLLCLLAFMFSLASLQSQICCPFDIKTTTKAEQPPFDNSFCARQTANCHGNCQRLTSGPDQNECVSGLNLSVCTDDSFPGTWDQEKGKCEGTGPCACGSWVAGPQIKANYRDIVTSESNCD